MAEAERLEGVQQDDVEVAGDAAVLEGVVEQDRPDGVSADRFWAAATRSGFCKCGTPGSRWASSRASSLAARPRAP